MNLIADAIKGTADVLPKDSYKWHYLEKTVKEVASQFDFKEIRTPVFEKTELFQRSVGDTTDVVQKEMYTFLDKGERSITLRPEGTAGAVRSVLEHGLFNEALPIKAYYISSCYRYEKPQAGRLREFHQFGVECFGAPSPLADAEIIMLGQTIIDKLGLKDISLEINSIGCPTCRAEFTNALKDFFSKEKENLCPTCQDRLTRNPMRILDCKSPTCREIAKDAPVILNYLDDSCKAHFESVKSYLTSANIQYKINPKIVRGLDYYTNTVFEFISNSIGSQGAVCAGGRYDGLTQELGGPSMPSLGFGMGLERMLMVMQKQGITFPEDSTVDLYIVPMGEKAKLEAFNICKQLRQEGFSAATDLNDRSLKAQMKYANKIGAKYTCVIGDNELETKTATLKNMKASSSVSISLPNGIIEAIYEDSINNTLEDLNETISKF